jgi:transposase
MSRQATVVNLSENDRRTLENWIRSGSTEQRLVIRARIILAAADGEATKDIASRLSLYPTTVSKWRMRFSAIGIAGLSDAARSGAPERYGEETEKRILDMLDESPPEGYSAWNGDLIAKALGDVSADHVWRVLRKHGVHLMRRHSWCISTDPEFAAKAADIVGLYLSPPENAVVLCVDEKPSIQALERAQGWLRLPDGKAITGFSHEYKRHGTTTLFGALEVATGQVKAGHYNRKRRREFLDFMNELVAGYSKDTELHVILDNLSTHKPKEDRWLARHPNVHFHFTPTHASWLNQIEIWFSILWRYALRGASFTSPRQVRQAIDRFIEAYSQTAHPFEWKKAAVTQKQLKNTYADLCN